MKRMIPKVYTSFTLLTQLLFSCSNKPIFSSFSLTERFQTPYSRDISNKTITHYVQNDLILYDIPMDLGNLLHQDRYYLKDTISDKAIMFVPLAPLSGFKPNELDQLVSIVDFEDLTGYKHNLELGKIVAAIDKKLINTQHPTSEKWQDIYIMPQNSNNKLDSIIILYDSKFKLIPFSFNPTLDKIHDSKVTSLRVVYHSKMSDLPNDSYDYSFKIKENTIKNPAKIDSIFTKLIPYLPKK